MHHRSFLSSGALVDVFHEHADRPIGEVRDELAAVIVMLKQTDRELSNHPDHTPFKEVLPDVEYVLRRLQDEPLRWLSAVARAPMGELVRLKKSS